MSDAKPFTDELEKIAEQIHGVYCDYYRNRHGKDYWTGGDYSKLDDATKEADRHMARFVLAIIAADRKRIEEQSDKILEITDGFLAMEKALDAAGEYLTAEEHERVKKFTALRTRLERMEGDLNTAYGLINDLLSVGNITKGHAWLPSRLKTAMNQAKTFSDNRQALAGGK